MVPFGHYLAIFGPFFLRVSIREGRNFGFFVIFLIFLFFRKFFVFSSKNYFFVFFLHNPSEINFFVYLAPSGQRSSYFGHQVNALIVLGFVYLALRA